VGVGFATVADGSQEVVYNKIRYFSSQPVANCEIGPKMDARKIRLKVASSSASEIRLKERCTPGKTSEVTANSKRSLSKKEIRTVAPLALIRACVPG
jgi:hypothetical protein